MIETQIWLKSVLHNGCIFKGLYLCNLQISSCYFPLWKSPNFPRLFLQQKICYNNFLLRQNKPKKTFLHPSSATFPFCFFPSSVFGTHSKSGFPITYSHGPGLKHCLFKVVFIIYIPGINYYSGLDYAFIFHLKMTDVHYQPLAIFKHF